MPRIAIQKIKVGSRFRQEYEDVESLAESIKTHGLLHPIVLDKDYNLLAGGRRLRAATMLGWTEIDYTIISAADPLARREIELEENIKRQDLTWAEECALKKAIDDLKKEQFGSWEDGIKSGWSKTKTAEYLQESPSGVQEDIQLAEALEAIPELAECKTKDEAKRKYKRLLEELAAEELARRGKQEPETDLGKVVKKIDSMYVIGDALAGMQTLPESECVFTIAEVDPPYGIDLPNQRQSKVDKSYNEVKEADYRDFITAAAEGVYRCLANNAWCIWWFGVQHQATVLRALRLAGFDVDIIPSIWVKPQGQTNWPDRTFARAWEPFFLARKGTPIMAQQGKLNVFPYGGVPAKKRIHPTERPLELLLDILSRLHTPGHNDKVLVPFLGSGNTLRAAMLLGMDGLGWDIEGEKTKALFTKRLMDDLKFVE